MITYSFMIGLGASLAVLRVIQNVPRWQASRWSNASLFCLLTGLAGSRLVYILFHLTYYKSHVLESFAIWEGGFSYAGALLGAYLGCWYMAKRWNSGVLKIADNLSPMIPPMVIFTWLGCWLGGFAYGWTAPQGAFWGVPASDEAGVILPRFPLQLIAATVMLIFAFWIEARKTPCKIEGQKAALIQFGMAIDLLLFMPMRADPSPILLGVRLDVLAALILFLFSAFVYFKLYFVSGTERAFILRKKKLA